MATQIIKISGYQPIINAVVNTVTFVNGGNYTDTTDYLSITGDMVYTSMKMAYSPVTISLGTTLGLGSAIQESVETFPVSIMVEKSMIQEIYQGEISGYHSL